MFHDINLYVVFAGLVCAFIFPSFRYFCRKRKDIEPAFQPALLKQDVPSGFVLPQYVELVFGVFMDAYHPNPTALILCVFYTSYLMVMDLTDNGRSPRMRTRIDDKC